MTHRTKLLALLSGASALAAFAYELTRVWRLGSLPVDGPNGEAIGGKWAKPRRVLVIAREGFNVRSTKENAAFMMLGSFVVTFAAARWVTTTIRSRGGFGPFHDVNIGDRHIHHFVPGVLMTVVAGGTAIASRDRPMSGWMALPFGAGLALVFDETALLLELEDVYWSQEGVLSMEVAFGAIVVLAVLAYVITAVRRGELRAREADWHTAADAWNQLQQLPGSGRDEFNR